MAGFAGRLLHPIEYPAAQQAANRPQVGLPPGTAESAAGVGLKSSPPLAVIDSARYEIADPLRQQQAIDRSSERTTGIFPAKILAEMVRWLIEWLGKMPIHPHFPAGRGCPGR